jgi:hypothetical protein
MPEGDTIRWAAKRMRAVLEGRVPDQILTPQQRHGPDVLAEDFDSERFLARLRAEDPTRGIGDALLDQSLVAGIGNIWKAEGAGRPGSTPGAGWPRSPMLRWLR